MARNRQAKASTPEGAHLSWETTETIAFGHGWISGLLSALFGIAGLGAVLCTHFPNVLTLPRLRSLYAIPYFRATLHLLLVASFLLGILSVCLRRNKTLGLIGVTLTLIATLVGSSREPLVGQGTGGQFLSLDWFVLNLLFYSAIYIPLERFFGKYPDQPTFRPQWGVDLTYFFFNTLLIQITTVLTIGPALVFFGWARVPAIQILMARLPLVVQIPAVLLVADFTQYWVHRAFHSIPFLWRFHSIHHSAEAMDWLAGARLHLVDAVGTRGLTYVPIYVLGFSKAAMVAYVMIVAIQATFIHANVRWEFPVIRRFIATPCFHHWHHAADVEGLDKNFSVHSPLWDWIFGTLHLPGRWPKKYGISGRNDVPASWAPQFIYPFRR